jgi:hypothetical protein
VQTQIDQDSSLKRARQKFDSAIKFHHSGHLSDAMHLYEEILQEFPSHFDALHLLGVAETQSYRPFLALDYFDRALKLNNAYAPLHSNRGIALKDLQNFDEALSCYNNAISLDSSFTDAYYNRGIVNLALGNFPEGWRDYERRAEINSLYQTSLKGHAEVKGGFSVCNGVEDLRGKTVFVASEQGIGDCIMFFSILPDLCRDAKHVICQAEPRLLGLLARCFPGVTFVRSGDVTVLKAITVDRYIRLGSLGYTYRHNLDDFPNKPYFKSNPAIRSYWQSRMPADPKVFNVGISWRGGSLNRNGAARSMTLDDLSPILDRSDCNFVSLQYGEVASEIDHFNAGRERKIKFFYKREIDDFEDFTALIDALDCVVSVQNTTVHACGALGKRCLTLLPRRPEWRYGVSGSEMPWYSSVELFRQSPEVRWSGPIDAINQRLTKLIESSFQ